MTLSEKQKVFSSILPLLIGHAIEIGYEITLGEAWRSPETAHLMAVEGKGIEHSLHSVRLAIDLNLFAYGKYLTSTEDYRVLGEYWESLSTKDYTCCWGGRFSHADGNHFSIEDGGIK